MGSFQTGFGGVGSTFPSAAAPTLPHYALQQGTPYNLYGYASIIYYFYFSFHNQRQTTLHYSQL